MHPPHILTKYSVWSTATKYGKMVLASFPLYIHPCPCWHLSPSQHCIIGPAVLWGGPIYFFLGQYCSPIPMSPSHPYGDHVLSELNLCHPGWNILSLQESLFLPSCGPLCVVLISNCVWKAE